MTTANDQDHAIAGLISGQIQNPHAYLGLHQQTPATPGAPATALIVRAFLPDADAVTLVETGGEQLRVPLKQIDPAGIFAASIPQRTQHFPYTFEIEAGGQRTTRDDPYRFLPTIGELDEYLAGEGNHQQLYTVLGAHQRQLADVSGVSFAIWAPNARGVSLAANCNRWNPRSLPLRLIGSTGIWEIFVPGIQPGEVYKYAIRAADGDETLRADPVGFGSELRPETASIVMDLEAYQWHDDDWLATRAATNPTTAPMSIYEVHPGSWRRNATGGWLSYTELADQLIPYVTTLGYTHIELMPVSEHPYDPSWGYQVTGFYAVTSRYGTPRDFQELIDRCHQAGIGVILDWVPAHFAVDGHGLARLDGTYLYEPADPQRRNQPDWGTYAFNYGRNEVRNFLLANALFWLEQYHIDGLRVDAVSSMIYLDYSRSEGEWTPNQHGGREHLEAIAFLREFNQLVQTQGRGAFTIAEEATAWPGVSQPVESGGLGFTFKWDMGWMHDTLDYLAYDPLYRQHHQQMLTFRQMYAYSELFVLALSHDEVVHLKRSLLYKMPGDSWQQLANLRLLFAYQHAQPGKKLVFMGGEFGQRPEWNQDIALDWSVLEQVPHQQLLSLIRQLNQLHHSEPPLHYQDHSPDGFRWLDFQDTRQSVLSFVRQSYRPPQQDGEIGQYDYLICIFNFTPVPRWSYRVPVVEAVGYRELLNTDAATFGGSGFEHHDLLYGEAIPHAGHDYSLVLNLPPLGAVFLKPEYSVQ